MAETHRDFVAFIEEFVLPLTQEHPDWLRFNGSRAGDPTPKQRQGVVAYLLHGDLRYGVDLNASIESILAPYRAWKAGKLDYPVIVGSTNTGRPRLEPMSGAVPGSNFYVYRQGKAPPLITVTIELPRGRDPGPGEVDKLVREATQRNERDAAFKDRVVKRWGGRCALTGCEDQAVLDAAHIDAHSWSGDNRATNGILLRSDLHRLWNRKLLSLEIEGKAMTVSVAPEVRTPEYPALDGRKITIPK